MIFQFIGGNFQNVFTWLDNIGLRDVILPFFLVFTVLYAVLQRVKLFGDNSKKYNSIISLAIAFMTVAPHITGSYPGGVDVVVIMNQALPEIALLVIVLIMFMLITGLLGGEGYKPGDWSAGAAVIGIIVLIGIMLSAIYPGSLPSWLYFINDPNLISVIIFLIVLGLIIKYLTEDESANKKSLFESLFGKPPSR